MSENLKKNTKIRTFEVFWVFLNVKT